MLRPQFISEFLLPGFFLGFGFRLDLRGVGVGCIVRGLLPVLLLSLAGDKLRHCHTVSLARII